MFIWAILLVVVMGASFAVASVALPRLFLKTRYTVTKSVDRGIKHIQEVNGQSIVYEPSVRWRKYVSQYILSERDGKKEFICKVSKDVTYLEMDIVLFNNQDKVFSVLKVKDFVDESGYGKVISLPEETSYVAIEITRADGQVYEDHLTAKISGGKLFKFLLCCSFVLIMEIMCVKVCMANLFGGVFRESFVVNWQSTLVTLIIALIAITLNVIATAIAVKSREKRYIKNEQKLTVKGNKK